jgi:hypothetical protein
MQFKAPNTPTDLKSEIEADPVHEGLEETDPILRENLLQVQQPQTKYTSGIDISFDIGGHVWLSKKYFWTTWRPKKLDYKHTGPYLVGVRNGSKYL